MKNTDASKIEKNEKKEIKSTERKRRKDESKLYEGKNLSKSKERDDEIMIKHEKNEKDEKNILIESFEKY